MANETRSHRDARALAKASGLTYQQARALLAATRDRPDWADPAAVAAFVAAHRRAGTAGRLSVYVTTVDGGLGPLVVDGDIAVRSLDWANAGPFGAAADVAAAVGLDDGLPAGLLDAITRDLTAAGWAPSAPVPGPDRPWAYITFCDETFASDGVWSSADVTVVYHDWSLWHADRALGVRDAVDVDAVRADAARLGPRAAAAVAEHADAYCSATRP